MFFKYHLSDSLYLQPQSAASLYYHKSRGDDPQSDFIFGSDNQIISVRRETNYFLFRHWLIFYPLKLSLWSHFEILYIRNNVQFPNYFSPTFCQCLPRTVIVPPGEVVYLKKLQLEKINCLHLSQSNSTSTQIVPMLSNYFFYAFSLFGPIY